MCHFYRNAKNRAVTQRDCVNASSHEKHSEALRESSVLLCVMNVSLLP